MINSPLPSNIEAEQAILGGILLDPYAIERIVHLLVVDAFFLKFHQEIYQACVALHYQGKPTDLMTVSTSLKDQGLLEKIRGINALAQLVDRTVSAVNIDRYAELLIDKYIRRKVIEAGGQISELGYDTTQELDKVLDQSEQKIFAIANKRLGSNTQPNHEIAASAYEELETISPIYATGLYDLDNMMVGFEPGTLTLLAGRPSMGKSAIANFFALSMMIKHRLPVIMFSLEMSKKQLEYRLWSLISGFPSYQASGILPIRGDRFRRHRAGLDHLTTDELTNINKILEIALELPLYINDNRGITVSSIASECRQLIAKKGSLGLIIVDYLQMMAEDSGGNRSYELGDVARGLYKLAADVNAPILALSQLNRAVESRTNKRPMMADLSQSGILEMVADNILLAYRDEYYNQDSPSRGILELILAKARHGETGSVTVYFDSAYGVLKNIAS
ncbi:MAG: replicative DNA helicase [Alphaproteobacteria bacterium]